MRKLSFPSEGRNQHEVFQELKDKKKNDLNWQHGRAFSYIYYADPELLQNLKKAYELYFSENALNPSAFPSLRNMEAEVVEMCLDLFQAKHEGVGLMTSGGTESILMAIKSAKNFTKDKIKSPEIILPSTAHPAFNKACDYFDIKSVIVDVEDDFRVSSEKMKNHITKNTIMLVGSAPSYPQGVIDPIEEIAALAKAHNLLCHVDACVGGFVLPFMENEKSKKFNMSIEGVTSLSADIHKYGFASKGSSVILYNNPDLRKAQFYIYTGWSGGIYASPSILGTKPGGAIAVAWTVLNLLGRKGYERFVHTSMQVTKKFQDFISGFEGIKLKGSADMCIFSFGSDSFDIYELGDEMQVKGWNMDRQQNPACLHISISPIHDKYFEEFKKDFTDSYKKVNKVNLDSIKKKAVVSTAKGLKKILPKKIFNKITKSSVENSDVDNKRSAAMYGMIGDLQGTGELDEMITQFLDKMLRINK